MLGGGWKEKEGFDDKNTYKKHYNQNFQWQHDGKKGRHTDTMRYARGDLNIHNRQIIALSIALK